MTRHIPWLPDDEVREIAERLRLWYTLEDMSALLGHTPASTRKKLNELDIEILWRENNAGKMARRWTRGERNFLINSAGRLTLLEVAAALGRSRQSIIQKACKLGIAWRRARTAEGIVSAQQIAKLAGCHPCYAASVARRLFGRTAVAHGKRSGRRYHLDENDARRLMAAIRPGRVDWVPRLFEGLENEG